LAASLATESVARSSSFNSIPVAHWNRHSGGIPFPERIGFQNGSNVEIAITINANQTKAAPWAFELGND
jgi:hypothetical protein